MSDGMVDLDSERYKTYQASLPRDLESQIMDPRIPKNEREWWASSEIRRLQDCLATHEVWTGDGIPPSNSAARHEFECRTILVGIIEDGPYCTDDGDCSFCHFAPNDSEDLDHLIAHKKDCKWRVAKEYLRAAIDAFRAKEKG